MGRSPIVVTEFVETVAEFHARLPDDRAPVQPDDPIRVWHCRPTDRAVVLGSTQSTELLDRAACRTAGYEIVRRRSGGGLVLVERGRTVWVDVVVPHGHVLWSDDIDRSAAWLGNCWRNTLASLGIEGLDVHEGAMERPPWSREVCFLGRASGEVTMGSRKAVGISQRRTRDWCRLQSSLSLRWEAETLRQLLAEPRPPLETLSAAGTDLPLVEDEVVRVLIGEVERVARGGADHGR